MPNIQNSKLSGEQQRLQLDFIKSLNRGKIEKETYNPKVEGLIESFELAFRMQSEIPELLDIESRCATTPAPPINRSPACSPTSSNATCSRTP